jgi:hypothetical protein
VQLPGAVECFGLTGGETAYAVSAFVKPVGEEAKERCHEEATHTEDEKGNPSRRPCTIRRQHPWPVVMFNHLLLAIQLTPRLVNFFN